METLHLAGFAESLNIRNFLSENYWKLSDNFCYNRETEVETPNIFFRFYETNKECSLEEAIEGFLHKQFGKLQLTGELYGYSEFTIEGCAIKDARIGGHDLDALIKSKRGKYLHILIDNV